MVSNWRSAAARLEETELLEETLHSHLRLPLIVQDYMSIMMLNYFFFKAIFTALPWAVGRVALPSGCQIQRQRGRSSSLAARKRPDPLQPSQLTPAAGSPPALWASPVSFGRVLILRFMNNAAPSACTDSRDCSSQQDTPETPLPSVPSNGSSKASWPLLSDRRRTTPSKELPIHQYHIKIFKL